MIKYFLSIKFLLTWGLGIGDWGLGIGDWGLGPIPQSPIPNPQSPIKFYKNNKINYKIINFLIFKHKKLNEQFDFY